MGLGVVGAASAGTTSAPRQPKPRQTLVLATAPLQIARALVLVPPRHTHSIESARCVAASAATKTTVGPCSSA